MALWLVRTGRHGEHEAKFLDTNRVYLTWKGLDKDLSQLKTADDFQKVQREYFPNQSDKAVAHYAGQSRAFVQGIQTGDWVIVPSKSKGAVSIGEVLTAYQFDPEADDPYYHSRDVKWVGRDVPRSNFSQDLLNSINAYSTVCRIKRNNAEERIRAMGKGGWKALSPAKAIAGEPGEADEEVDLDLEQIARDQIGKLISQNFTKHELARLIDAILQAQGYTTYLSPAGPDKGIDILAAPGPLGFGSPKLCVQVKSGDTPVDTPTLNQLIGSMQNVQAEQGLLVSWAGFKASVHKEVPAQFFRVRLWDQEAIIGELVAVYDKLPEDLRAELPLKRVWAVALPGEGE